MLAALLAIRVIKLNADPPQVFPNGFRAIEPFTDEAAKAYQARNLVLFGKWSTSDQDDYQFWKVLSPVWVYPLAGWFKLFGVSYASMRMFSVFWFGVGLALIYFALRKKPGPDAAAFASFFYGVNFYLLIFSRLGLMETMLNTFLLAAFLALALSRQKKLLFPVGTAVFILAYFVKQNALLFAPVVVAGYFLTFGPPWKKAFWKNPSNWLSLSIAVLAAAYLYHLWGQPLYRLYTMMNLRHGYGLPPDASRAGMVIRPDMMKAALLYHLSPKGFWQNFLAFDPAAGLLAVFAILALILSIARKKELSDAEVLAAVWLLSIQGLMLLSSARVVRFWILEMPALAILAGAGLSRIQKLFGERSKIRFVMVAVVLLASFELNFRNWLDWERNAQYQMRDAGKKLEQALGDKPATVVGKWAGPLLLNSRHQYYYIKSVFNRRPEQAQSFGINYLLLGDVPALVRDKFELENDPYAKTFSAAFPEKFEKKAPVASFKFYDGELTLYRVDGGAPN
jgi:4-amino-4-deoxy-L-arabinose transferase-like glycosyltransferase